MNVKTRPMNMNISKAECPPSRSNPWIADITLDQISGMLAGIVFVKTICLAYS